MVSVILEVLIIFIFYNKHHSQVTKDKLKRHMLGKKPVNRKQCEINGIVYDSVSDVAKQFGITPSAVIYRLKSSKYNTWRYL